MINQFKEELLMKLSKILKQYTLEIILNATRCNKIILGQVWYFF
jgi:hypothetical protein